MQIMQKCNNAGMPEFKYVLMFTFSNHQIFKGVPINSSITIKQATAFEKEKQIPLFFFKNKPVSRKFAADSAGFSQE